MKNSFYVLVLLLLFSCKKEEENLVKFDVYLKNAKSNQTLISNGSIRVIGLGEDGGLDFEAPNGKATVTVDLGQFIIKEQEFIINAPGYKQLRKTELIGKDQNEVSIEFYLIPDDDIIFTPNPLYIGTNETSKTLQMRNNGVDSLACTAEVLLVGSSSWLSISNNSFFVGPVEQTNIVLTTNITNQLCRETATVVVSYISDGLKHYDSIQVIKDILDITAPNANISVVSNSINQNDTILFDASGSSDNCGELDYRWDFENTGNFTPWSTTSLGKYVYTTIGNKTVKLEVRDIQGLTNIATVDILVQATPTPPIFSSINPIVVSASDSVLKLEMTASLVSFGNLSNSLINHGFVWSQNTNNPTLANFTGKKELGTLNSLGGFSALSNQLLPNVKYYFRAFAQNGSFTEYSEVVEFIPQVVIFSNIDLGGSNLAFVMGSSIMDQSPQHNVVLSNFKLSTTEVTNEQFAAFLNSNNISISQVFNYLDINSSYSGIEYIAGNWRSKLSKEEYPVVMVSWLGAKDFCTWAGGRLPTEAEWEFAALSDVPNSLYSGTTSSLPDAVAHYNGNSSNLNPVKTKNISIKWGLYDMNGNAAEWCSDWYGTYSAVNGQTNPTGPSSGSQRVVRGGSFLSSAQQVQNKHRDKMYPAFQQNNIGFRVAKNM